MNASYAKYIFSRTCIKNEVNVLYLLNILGILKFKIDGSHSNSVNLYTK